MRDGLLQLSARRRIEHAVVVAAPTHSVWDRAVTPEGFNHEMRPWMTMTLPRAARHLTVDTIPLGQPIGRAQLRLLGVLPFDYDRLAIVEREAGRRFLERSSMLSMRLWQHERVVTPIAESTTRVQDIVMFEPRLLLRPIAGVLAQAVDGFFRHRQRRLQRYWAAQ